MDRAFSTNGGEEDIGYTMKDIGGEAKRPLGRPRCRFVV
jgi:hypothetical protein